MKSDVDELTTCLREWRSGKGDRLHSLLPLVYRELRRLAASCLRRERESITLQPTVLVHETYLRLAAQTLPDWESRSHFFGVAARLMRQILVDHARRSKRNKRGGGARPEPIDSARERAMRNDAGLLALDDALSSLARLDARKSQILELRFFGGLTVEETAQTLTISGATVIREQRLAEAWLHRELTDRAAA
jgi:RNA polymerase sigma-70 factor, ECF subfamily